jgi:hypothetical protein
MNQQQASFYIGSAALVCASMVAICAFVGDVVYKNPSEVGNILCVVCAAICVTSVIMNIIFISAFPPTNLEEQEEIKSLVNELTVIRDDLHVYFKAKAYDNYIAENEQGEENNVPGNADFADANAPEANAEDNSSINAVSA